jgi:hypothetical protein
MANNYPVNWEKVGVYIAMLACFLTVVVYIADIKERIAKLEVKVEKLEEK